LANVLPITGKIVAAGTDIVSFLFAAVSSLTDIALLVLAADELILLRKTFKPKAVWNFNPLHWGLSGVSGKDQPSLLFSMHRRY
jgi:hypothetical protein